MIRAEKLTAPNQERLPYGPGLRDGMICTIEDEQREVVWCERWGRWIYLDTSEEGPRIFGRPK